MKFGQLSIDDANGRVLAHPLRLPEGTFSKGHVLKDCDLARLKQAELRHVTDARMNSDDVGEDQAAWMLGQSIATEDIKPIVAIVLLAAGMATRMGPNGGPKLLAEFDGMPLVRRSAFAASNSHAESVIVVVGHRQDDIRKALSDLQLNIVANRDYASGMASSLVIGFASAEANGADGVLVMLADMPGVTSSDLNRLITAFQDGKGASIVRAVSQGKRGNPVILPRSLNNAVLRLKGDVGARYLIKASGLPVIEVEIGDAAQIDVDTPEAIIAAGGIPAES